MDSGFRLEVHVPVVRIHCLCGTQTHISRMKQNSVCQNMAWEVRLLSVSGVQFWRSTTIGEVAYRAHHAAKFGEHWVKTTSRRGRAFRPAFTARAILQIPPKCDPPRRYPIHSESPKATIHLPQPSDSSSSCALLRTGLDELDELEADALCDQTTPAGAVE